MAAGGKVTGIGTVKRRSARQGKDTPEALDARRSEGVDGVEVGEHEGQKFVGEREGVQGHGGRGHGGGRGDDRAL